MGPVLQLEGLCKKYPAFALEDVSFSVEPGEIMGFIGRNGAGKTTTLKAALHLVHPDAGRVRFFGLDYGDHEAEIRRRIGYAAGGTVFYPRKRLGDIAAVTRTFYENWDDAAWKRCCDRFALDEGKRVQELSEGMKVKFSLALALSHRAELLLLDEPTSGLDPVSRAELLELFAALRAEGTAILFSTHITTDLEECADRITYLRRGRVAASKPKAAFLADYPDCPSLERIMVRLEKEAAE